MRMCVWVHTQRESMDRLYGGDKFYSKKYWNKLYPERTRRGKTLQDAESQRIKRFIKRRGLTKYKFSEVRREVEEEREKKREFYRLSKVHMPMFSGRKRRGAAARENRQLTSYLRLCTDFGNLSLFVARNAWQFDAITLRSAYTKLAEV